MKWGLTDYTAIHGLAQPPPAHPGDKSLLRSLAMLGKRIGSTTGVSFLRRTEYISSDTGRAKVDTSPLRARQSPKKRKASEAARDDDPVRMLRGIYKGFDTAYPSDAYRGPDTAEKLRGDAVTSPDAAAWEKPKHPTNEDLTPLDTYPILPDLCAFPDSGNFYIIKFSTNPVAASDTYDKRLDVAILHPQLPFPDAQKCYEDAKVAYEADPSLPAPKAVDYNYTFYLPEDLKSADAAIMAADSNNPDHDNDSLHPYENEEGRRYFRYHYQRTYETYNQSSSHDDQWGESLTMSLHDPQDEDVFDADTIDTRKLQKAAYVYPVVTRAIIRPKRKTHLGAPSSHMEGEEGYTDFADVRFRDPNEAEVGRRSTHRQTLEEGLISQVNGIHDAEGDMDEAAT